MYVNVGLLVIMTHLGQRFPRSPIPMLTKIDSTKCWFIAENLLSTSTTLFWDEKGSECM